MTAIEIIMMPFASMLPVVYKMARCKLKIENVIAVSREDSKLNRQGNFSS
jgi:hypothetical protein